MRELNNLQRPRHIDDNKEKLTNILADDFQNDIKDELIKAISKHNLTGNLDRKDVTIVVEINANRDYRLIGLLKNTLDASSGVLFIDDSSVNSVLISRIEHDVEHKDKMKVWVLENIIIRGCHIDKVTLENNTVVYAEFDTVLESNYLPYQAGMVVTDDVIEDTRVIGESLFGDMKKQVKAAELSIHLITGLVKTDIDNIALTIIAATVGRVVERIEDIKVLNIYQEQDRRRKGSMKVEIEIGIDGNVIYKKESCYIKKRLEDIKSIPDSTTNVAAGKLKNKAIEAERRENIG